MSVLSSTKHNGHKNSDWAAAEFRGRALRQGLLEWRPHKGTEQCGNLLLHGREDFPVYLVLYLQIVSTIWACLTDVRKQLDESNVYPWKQILWALFKFQRPSEYRLFLPDITLSVFVYGVRTGRGGRPFLSLVPGLLPVSSFISALPKMQPWSRAWILPGTPNQHKKATNGYWWHLLSRTVFYCFYSITSNWKVSQIFLRQLSDIYR